MRQAGCGILGCIGILFIGVIGLCVAMDIAARFEGPGFTPPWASRGESVDLDTDDPVELGEALYEENCTGCHSTDGSSRTGPTFQGLYGSEVTTEDGETVIVDESHLHTAITDPGADVRQGYPEVMPDFDGFSEDEVDALIAFIRSLE